MKEEPSEVSRWLQDGPKRQRPIHPEGVLVGGQIQELRRTLQWYPGPPLTSTAMERAGTPHLGVLAPRWQDEPEITGWRALWPQGHHHPGTPSNRSVSQPHFLDYWAPLLSQSFLNTHLTKLQLITVACDTTEAQWKLKV